MKYGIRVVDTDDVGYVGAEVHLGTEIRAAREARGWSQEKLAAEMAQHIGVKLGQSGVVRLEKGERPTRLGEALAIMRFLKIDMRALGLDLGLIVNAAAVAPPVVTDDDIASLREVREAIQEQLDELVSRQALAIEALRAQQAMALHLAEQVGNCRSKLVMLNVRIDRAERAASGQAFAPHLVDEIKESADGEH